MPHTYFFKRLHLQLAVVHSEFNFTENAVAEFEASLPTQKPIMEKKKKKSIRLINVLIYYGERITLCTCVSLLIFIDVVHYYRLRLHPACSTANSNLHRGRSRSIWGESSYVDTYQREKQLFSGYTIVVSILCMCVGRYIYVHRVVLYQVAAVHILSNYENSARSGCNCII